MRENLMPTKKKLEHWQVVTLMLMAYDFLAVIVSYFFALWIRFDCKFSEIEPHYLHTYYRTIIIYALFCVVVFQFTKLYRSIWRFASYSELLRVLLATGVMGLAYISVTSLFVERMPISYYVFGLLVQFILTLGIRFSYRFVLLLRGRRKEEVHEKKVMVVGAGKAGQMLLRDIKGAKEINEKVVCFIDDNPNKWDRFIDNVPIFGGRERIMEAVKKFGAEKIYVAIPSARPEDNQMLLRDIKGAKEINEKVVCFIDDNPNKWDRFIDNVPIFGGRERIMEAVKKFGAEKIYVAIPSARPEDKREILQICNETSCKLMNLPGMYQLYTGEVLVSKMKPVQIEDLLGRDPIKTDMKEVFEYITGKVVLVTGVGSIGSELARQIAAHHPSHLILFDIYENNAYDIQLELIKKYPELKLDTIIGSVRDSRKIFQVFEQYRPQIVYHAAAHKHVPLMEDSPCEAIKNNAMGTYKTAYAAMSHGCEKFVLISTDKAVNPTNIMGASKRLCEMIIQAFDAKIKEGKAAEIPQLFTHSMQEVITSKEVTEALKNTKTEFVAVRFGNVLGSNGSVVPLFKKQIEAGGPVTVTHIGSVRDSRKIFQVFEQYRPQIVYHAAAHKHVPLMEDSPCEAIKNNAM